MRYPVRILVYTFIWLLWPLASQAEYSHTYLDSYPLKVASVGQLELAYRIVEQHPDKPKAAAEGTSKDEEHAAAATSDIIIRVVMIGDRACGVWCRWGVNIVLPDQLW